MPFVSSYLLWSRRDALRRLIPRPSWSSGGLVLLLAVGMTVAARAGGIQILEQLAFLVALTAAVLLLFGAAFVRVAWAALAYLLLMIPLSDASNTALFFFLLLHSSAYCSRPRAESSEAGTRGTTPATRTNAAPKSSSTAAVSAKQQAAPESGCRQPGRRRSSRPQAVAPVRPRTTTGEV